jgi:hypothetical protein
MDLDDEARRQIAVSVVAVGFFVALILGIGVAFSNSGLGATGGLALVGAIVLFILVMAGVGLFLAD